LVGPPSLKSWNAVGAELATYRRLPIAFWKMVFAGGKPTAGIPNCHCRFDLRYNPATRWQNRAINEIQIATSSLPVKSASNVYRRVPIKEVTMSLDKIVVLVMAIAFFGGLTFLFWKSRHSEQEAGQAPSPVALENDGRDLSNNMQEKRRKHPKA
jgi:hypothetical protein